MEFNGTVLDFLSFQLMLSHQQKVQHIFLRAGFGEIPSRISEACKYSVSELVDQLFVSSWDSINLDLLQNPATIRAASNLKILFIVLRSQKNIEDLNIAWIKRMAQTQAALREKMTLFWHNHFATSAPFDYLMQVQNNCLRKHALGSFASLLHCISKDPAMILYLNNQENKKDAPNENFAREVMELFTLGEGHYSESDIKNSARAFTGWTVNKYGKYEFVPADHDDREKVFMDQTGPFNGSDIINIILQQKQTAYFITRKIYREFVNENANEEIIQPLAENFYASDYDISLLLKTIFKSEWFYNEENVGSKISSPVELLVRYFRLLHPELEKENSILDFQQQLGQVLFFPPNVAGWKGGRSWIDNTSLPLRMSLPERITADAKLELQESGKHNTTSTYKRVQLKSKNITTNWTQLINHFYPYHNEALLDKVVESFIQSSTDTINKNDLWNSIDHSTHSKEIINTISAVMSLPEFQLI